MSRSVPFSPLRNTALALLTVISAASACMSSSASAAEGIRGMPHAAEMQREPRGYTRFERPQAADHRPSFDRAWFGHNFQARHGYRIGPYHGPDGYAYHRWVFGEMLPGPFWASDYLLTDFWLFGLEIPPAGYEWVRYGPDAILVHLGDGEIGEVVYGTFM